MFANAKAFGLRFMIFITISVQWGGNSAAAEVYELESSVPGNIRDILEELKAPKLTEVVESFCQAILLNEPSRLYAFQKAEGVLSTDYLRNENFGVIDRMSRALFYSYLEKSPKRIQKIKTKKTQSFIRLLGLMKRFIAQKAPADDQVYLLVSFAVAATGSVLKWSLRPKECSIS